MGNLKKSFILFLFFFGIFSSPCLGEEIPLIREGGVFLIPVEINGVLTLPFILDTGAAEVSIPADVVMTLVRTGTLSTEDFLEGKNYVLADGAKVRSPRFMIHQMKLGNRVIRNIPASVSDVEGQLLVGQNLLEKFGTYTLDHRRQVLILGSEETMDDSLLASKPQGERGVFSLPKEDIPNGPTDTVKNFFNSVDQEKFEVSWKSLSAYSQKRIVQMVAQEVKSSPEDVRRLFEENDDSIRKGFWKSFRESSSIPTLARFATFYSIEKGPNIALVLVRLGSQELSFQVYQEGGKWKMGLIESIEQNKN